MAAEGLADWEESVQVSKRRRSLGDEDGQDVIPLLEGEADGAAQGAKLSPEQQTVLAFVEQGKNVFMTGCAGTGKSFVLHRIRRVLCSMHGPGTVYVTAFTGIAALPLRGTTLHSFAGIPNVDDKSKDDVVGMLFRNKDKRTIERWRCAKALIIDEISMTDGGLFDKLEYLSRKVRSVEQPFGGLQLIVSGDFLQLPPVDRQGNKTYAFQAETWNACFHLQIELTQVFRQQGDQVLIRLLSEVRKGVCSEQTLDVLERCQQRPDETTDGSLKVEPTIVYPHNVDVDTINASKLQELPMVKHHFIAADRQRPDLTPSEANQLRKGLDELRAETLTFCRGAQVILVKNLKCQGVKGGFIANGARGVVVDFCSRKDDPGAWAAFDANFHTKTICPGGAWPVVEFACDRGVYRIVGPVEWTVEHQDKELGSRSQVPLRLAWALTVHKCQGMTLDRMETELSRAFGYGMAYVALSRVKSLDGLFFRNFNRNLMKSKIRADPRVLEFYHRFSERQS